MQAVSRAPLNKALDVLKSAVVLDKNYLQGASRTTLGTLAESHRFIMTGALFYELLTTDLRERQICFSRLPQCDNPVELVDHVGVLLRREQTLGIPCGKPSLSKLDVSFRFNPRLLGEDYQLPPEAVESLAEHTLEIASDRDRLVELSDTTATMFPGLLKGSTDDQQQVLREAQAAIADPSQIVEFYRTLESPDPKQPFPPAHQLGTEWAHLRWLQVLMLFAVDLHVRYRGSIATIRTPNLLERLEHDVHDAELLVLGILEGAFATRERKLIEFWRILGPDGTLFT